MEVVHPRCSGLDVHKKSVVACVMVPGRKEVRTFGTVTAELMRLGDWLQEESVTHVAMESTGVYWKPVFNVLETTGLKVLVVNAQHIKVPTISTSSTAGESLIVPCAVCKPLGITSPWRRPQLEQGIFGLRR